MAGINLAVSTFVDCRKVTNINAVRPRVLVNLFPTNAVLGSVVNLPWRF